MPLKNNELTVGELVELLQKCDPTQGVVFTNTVYGDFDVLGTTGACLSEDNFVKDRRPIFQIAKRRD